ncbi:hypothetical protein PZH32_02340 [Adlercreutzia equolifaciens]|uniref:hypothetical protein n=1 Tax=Adlercreutzia equolifaciens TaxID=446660 RepID=UPI0023B1171D|nr:hypothetical protein [Adlercreutzia equolifaciens]MDE8701797.1 hypothetical protein [Adlercreutzia equolifaciens]
MNFLQKLIGAITSRPKLAKGLFGGLLVLVGTALGSLVTRKVDAKKYQEEIASLQKVIIDHEAEILILEQGRRGDRRKARKLAKQSEKLMARIVELEGKLANAE